MHDTIFFKWYFIYKFLNIAKRGKYSSITGIEEKTHRREDKGRRCCFGDGIHSNPRCTTDLAPGWFKEKGWIEERRLGRIDASENWMINWSSGSHNAKPPSSQNGCSSKGFLQIILADNCLALLSSTSPKQHTVTTFAFSSVCFFFYDYKIARTVAE